LNTATTKNIISALGINTDTNVLFLLSVPAQLKAMLLETANLLVYTPSNEHFGIVPLEAMLAGIPVLAADSGGPLETVVEDETGWLRPSDDIDQWTKLMCQVLFEMPDEYLAIMGERGRRRVISEFSHTKMASRLDEEIEAMVNSPRHSTNGISAVLVGLGISGAVLLAIIAIILKSS
jgi:alpha-1,3/alpha-1,6-mannosyltransferase